MRGITHVQLTEISLYVVAVLQVRSDIKMSAKTQFQRLLSQPQRHEIHFVQVGADGGIKLFRREQGIYINGAVSQFVVGDDVGLCPSVLQYSIGGDVREVQVAVLQLSDGR